MIIVYPKYFVMPVIMDDDFELNHSDNNLLRFEESNSQNEEKGEFDEIDDEFVKEETKG